MKIVNRNFLPIFFVISACTGEIVSNLDTARAAYEQGDLATAQFHVRSALEKDPANHALTFLSGRISLDSGNPDRAKGEFGMLLNDPEFGSRARVLLAKAHLMTGKSRLALEALGDTPPETALGFAVGVGANLLEGKTDTANTLLDKGLAKFPDSADLLVLDGTRALQTGDRDRATALAERVTDLAPKDLNARLFAARTAMLERDLSEAEKHFNAVLSTRPKHQTALLGKAAIAHDRGDRTAAKEILKEASQQLGGSSLAVSYFLAQLAFDGGEVDRAHEILQGHGNLQNLPAAVKLNGLVAARRGQHEQAIASLRRYFSNGDEDGRARFALASSYYAVGEKEKSWEVLHPLADAANADRRTLRLAAKLAGALGLPAKAYQAREAEAARGDPLAQEMAAADKAISAGEWKKADGIYKQLLARRPNTTNVILLNNAASVRMKLGRLGEAVKLARLAHKQAPNDPMVTDTLGWALFKANGPTPEAARLLGKAARKMPGNPNIRAHLLALRKAREST